MFRRKLIYLCFLGALWILKVLYLFRIVSLLFYLFLVLPVILFLMLQWQKRKVTMEVMNRNIMVEKEVPYAVQFLIENHSHLPIYRGEILLRYRNKASERWKKEWLYFTAETGSSVIKLQQVSKYSASLECIPVCANIYDMLGLFRATKWKKKTYQLRRIEIKVLPKLHALLEKLVRPNPSVMVEGERYSDHKGGDDPAQVFDIRTYQDGDRLNRIHWKMTVKKDELMVKEFGFPIDCSVLVLLDIGKWNKEEQQLKMQDALLEVALSISCQLVQEEQIHYLAWNVAEDSKIQRQRIASEEDFYLAAGSLLEACIRKQDVTTPAAYLSEYAQEQYSNIFYISASEKFEEDAGLLLENRKSAWLHLIQVGGTMKTQSELYQVSGVYPAQVSVEHLAKDMSNLLLWEGGASYEA